MFPSFIGILDIQSWWEVPCIAHFCSLFRAAFNLLDFDIEELEEALLTDGTEESASSLLTELIVRLLCGCLGNNDISAFNYQMFLRRLFRQKCQETGRYNPFNTDIDFQFLPLRTKVEILFALCDFRLDADDVFELFKNLEAESLRVEPLGWDSNSSAYWYFYGTRLYREDYKVKPKGKKRKKVDKKTKSEEFEDDTERVWQVVCFTESDWINLTEKFKGSASKLERDLYQSLSENFLPEIPRLFQEKERLQRKRLLELAPRRTSSRVQIKQKQKEEEESKVTQDIVREKNIEIQIQQHKKKTDNLERESRVRRREKLRTQSEESSSSDSSQSGTEDCKEMWPKRKKRKLKTRESSLASPSSTTTTPPKPTGRQTNNSLACATGQIVIPDIREPTNPTRKKVKSSQIYELLDQDLVVDMYKVLEQLKSHDDAWPFMDPVEEDYAPNYYTVIRRPMDLKKMEDRLDEGYYTDFSMFKNDFKLIVNNCRLYNGQESEYTKMVNNLEGAFNKLTQRYFEGESSSDDEIAIEYPIQNPYPRKQSVNKRGYKNSAKNDFDENQIEDEVSMKGPEKRKSNDNYDDDDDEELDDLKKSKKLKANSDEKSTNSSPEKKERSKSKSSHLKKKKKLKRLQDARKSRKDKHKKTKDKKKHSKRNGGQKREKKVRRALSEKFRSRINSTSSQINEDRPVAIKRHSSPEIDFYKDKFDKIKERRRGCVKKIDDYGLYNKHKDKKSNLSVPEKDKHLNLKETIEKLKAKSDAVKPQPIYNDLYEPENIPIKKEKKFADSTFPEVKKKCGDEYEFVDDDEVSKEDSAKTQVNIKNESAREALEQAMKDINKWLDDTPKLSEFGSNSNSPLQIPITDEFNISPVLKQEDETSNSQPEKEKIGTSSTKKDSTKKRQSNKDPAKTVTKKKEVQRTIDRLQPGKSKGNLISNIQTTTKQEENVIVPIVKVKDMKNALIMKTEEGSPKLSLGTVLPTVGFGLGKQHNFTAEQNVSNNAVKVEVVDMGTMTGEHEEHPVEETASEVVAVEEPEVVKEKEVEPTKSEDVMKQCQEKATPNLSAWFKAFGAPKSVAPSTPLSKKKTDDYEQDDSKINTSPLDSVKNDQGDDLLVPDGSESPIGNLGSVIRARRTSTGSSISERSSFSQDLDSPRHQPSHPSPLLRSPASPRTEEVQKTYPLMNVTVRVGFYQDTTSVKSSPEKSCSPREAPQSPYANYSQHVYASAANGNNNSNNPALTYPSEGSNKSPIPAYAQAPYYENVKVNSSKPNQEDFTVYSSDNAYQQPSSPFTGPFSPAKSPYSHHSQHSPYSLVQSPQTSTPATPPTVSNVIQSVDRRTAVEKSSAFPVKKRSYDIPGDATKDESRQQSSPDESDSPTPTSAPPSNEAFNDSPEMVNNPSVITSTHSKSAVPANIGYPYDTVSSRELSKQTKEDFQNKSSILSQYPDYASDYSIKNSQVNDYSLAGLSKAHSEINPASNVFLDSQLGQQSMFGDLKNISKGFSHDYTLKDKQVDMVNMGYSSKLFESMKNKDSNLDLVNMGYMQSEAHAHLAKLQPNPDDLRNIGSYYNPPSGLSYPGRLEQNTQAAKVTAASDYMELNKRYGYTAEKSNSVLQYMKSSEMNPAHNPDILQLNSPLLRSDCNKQGVPDNPDNFVRSATDQMYKDWMKKNQDAHNLSLYKDNQSKGDNKMSVSQMATSSSSNVIGRTSDTPTYDTSASPEDGGVHKNQAELRVQPGSGVHFIRAVIKISSSIKPDSQPQTPEYNLRRNVNLNLPVTSTKSDTTNYERSAPLTSTNAYKSSHTQPSHPIDQSLLNIPNLPQIMERYAKDERMLNPYTTPTSMSSAYQDKNMPLMFPKNMNSVHGAMTSSQMYQPASAVPKPYGRTDNPYSQSPQPTHNWPSEPISLESDKKAKSRKKKNPSVSSTPPSTSSPSYNYSTPKPSLPSSDPAMTLKPPNMLAGSAFNFGAPGSLTSSLYGDSSYFLDPSTNQYMAANYITAHQRSTPEIDKGGKPAHSSTPFQFLSPQVRPGYPLVGMESPSIYQQYIQRQQEEFLRPLHSQIMGMFPPGYNPSLGGRQPFDSIPRPWL